MLKKVLVVGLDGLEPSIVERLWYAGELPNLARLAESGGYGRVRTTTPAQTPVAWSTFATGTNPGGHGIYDFIRRDPNTYLPDLGLSRYEQKNAFLPPKAVNLRRGKPVWDTLTTAGVPSVVLRCPCTYPPDDLKGRMLSGMGVPDLRGGLGTSTFYTSAAGVAALESENVVHIRFENGSARTHLIGPRHPKTRDDARLDIAIEADRTGGVMLRTDGEPKTLALRPGEWSAWVKVKFKFGMLQSVSGMLRFLLVRTQPALELYASPINFDAASPMFPISSPWDYAGELQRELGTYYTTGMVEDHTGLSNGRFDEETYLAQCEQVLAERERMMTYELDRFKQGLFFCLFDTPDRIQHMFWRFREPDHPALNGDGARAHEFSHVIEEHYRRCDAIVGRALEYVDDDTLFIVLSDHGFGSFRRGVHLNGWLHRNGLLALKPGMEAGEEAGDFFKHVDWSRTQAYALGLGSIYLNVRGREANGIVEPADANAIGARVAEGLTGLRDPATGDVAVRRVISRAEAYSGAYASESPDLVASFARGYRVSWATALGGVPTDILEDNVKRWSGDHIVDPELVPGVLFMNRLFRADDASLVDLAPTILDALGVPAPGVMEGRSLLQQRGTS